MHLESIRHFYLRYIVGTALQTLGIKRSTALATWLARGVFEMRPPGRAIAEGRLRAAWRQGLLGEIDEDKLDGIVAAMYAHIGRFWIETLFARRRMRDPVWRQFVSIDGEDRLQALADSARGCLLATAYHGNIAVGAMALGRIFRSLHVIVDMLTQPMLRSWQRDLLNLPHVRPIWRSEATRRVPEVLQGGGAVMLVAEHARPRGRAVPVSFLGQQLGCYPTMGRLAQAYGVPVGVVMCRRRTETFQFDLALHDEIEPAPHDMNGGDAIVRRAMRAIERAILAEPEQYLWSNPVQPEVPQSAGQTEAAMPARGLTAPDAMPVSGGLSATGRGTESATSRRTRRTSSAWQRPSSADTRQGSPAEATEPAPRA